MRRLCSAVFEKPRPGSRTIFSSGIPADTAPPVILDVEAKPGAGGIIRARVHDNKSPLKAHDFQRVELVVSKAGQADVKIPMTWYGEYLWRAAVDAPAGATFKVCAADARGNAACSK